MAGAGSGTDTARLWRGELEWQERGDDTNQKITHTIKCEAGILTKPITKIPEISEMLKTWPEKLVMRLLSQSQSDRLFSLLKLELERGKKDNGHKIRGVLPSFTHMTVAAS